MSITKLKKSLKPPKGTSYSRITTFVQRLDDNSSNNNLQDPVKAKEAYILGKIHNNGRQVELWIPEKMQEQDLIIFVVKDFLVLNNKYKVLTT